MDARIIVILLFIPFVSLSQPISSKDSENYNPIRYDTAISDVDTLGGILKNAATEVAQLDSCIAIGEFKDSVLIEAFKMLENYSNTVVIYKSREDRFHEILSNNDEILIIQDGIIKKEKKKRNLWKFTSIGLTALLILVII